MQTQEDEIAYLTTGAAARILGFKDTRTAIRLVERGELAGHRLPGPKGHWRIERDSVLAALERYRPARAEAS